MILLMCNWVNKVDIIEFEGLYDPKYLKNVDRSDPEAWKIYAEKARDIMSKGTGLPKTEFGFRHWKDFKKLYF